MATGNFPLYAFNRGIMSPLGLARTDLKRAALSAQVMTNWMPRVLGSMMLRPGKQFLGSTNTNARGKFIPFVFANNDVALLETTDSTLRIWLNETVLTRVSVATTVTNGNFTTDLTGWTSADEAGAVSSWVAPGLMQLMGTGFTLAKRFQSVTPAPVDLGKEHALRIIILQETVTLRVGTSAADDSYVIERTLGVGTHSISFTPTGTFFVAFANNVNVGAQIASVAIEGPGPVTLPTPWPLSVLSPNLLRWDQSGDIIYVACDGFQQRKILRTQGSTNPRSWSIVLYQPKDGPFLIENIGPVTLTPSGTTGAITLTSSEPFFRSGHAGALFRIASIGQSVSASVSGTQQFTAPIKVTGVGTTRTISLIISGTWVGTVQLQQSVGAVGSWSDVPLQSFTSNTNGHDFDDGFDNSVIFYRLGFDATYTSGTAVLSMSFPFGTITGICRVTSIQSATVANANVQTLPGDTGVLQGLGSINPSFNWWEGQWSALRGFPTSVAFLEGRLWWAGRDAIIGSVSDAFESFDEITNIGDDGPINRTVGSGPVDVINWILPLQRMVLGTGGAEKSARSSSFDSPLTPTDFLLKDAGTQGSAAIAPVKIDFNGVFVQRSGRRVYQLAYSPNFIMDYSLKDLTNFCPDIAIAENGVPLSAGGFAGIDEQRQPDTRIHGWLNDGTVRVLIIDPLEDEQAWVKVQSAATLGGAAFVEDVVILPGPIEDLVYYVVRRIVSGSTVRYLERWAREDECWGNAVSKCIDAHVTGTNTPASKTISGLSHLIGEQVVCWADGIDQGTFTVSGGGTITLPTAVAQYCAGLAYTAQFQSSKLAYAAQDGTALTQAKRLAQLAVIMSNAHYQGLKYGPDFNTLVSLPLVTSGKVVPPNTVYTAYDQQNFEFPSKWDTDARLCLQAASPRPITLLAAIIDIETREA